MNIHPDTITDLTILYHAGEASQATRTMLEQLSQSDAALAAQLAAPPRASLAMPMHPPDKQREAIDKLARRNRLFSLLMACTYFFCLAPFSFVYGQGHLKFLLLRDAPLQAGMLLLIGLGFAFAAWSFHKRD